MESSFAICENNILTQRLPQCFSQALADQTLLHLAACRARIVVDFEQDLRPLLPSYPVTAEVGPDVVEARQSLPRPEPQHRGDTLAQDGVGGCDHHRLRDTG